MNLSEEERESVSSALAQVGARTGRAFTLESLVDRWHATVAEVEAGYSLTGYDYADDLGTRDLIEEILTMVVPSVRDKVVTESLGTADHRFLEATRELGRSLTLGGKARNGWWWKRAPKDLTGELAADILAD